MSVIFMPGVNIRTVTLTTLPDVPVEGDEDLMATLTVSTNNIDSGRIDVAVSDASVTITENIGMRFMTWHCCLTWQYNVSLYNLLCTYLDMYP